MQVVILASGEGKRLRPITNRIPKPLIKINHKELLWYLMKGVEKLNVKEIIITIPPGEKSTLIKNFLKNNFNHLKTKFIIQQKPLGTGHALLITKGLIEKEFYVFYSDLLIHPEVFQKLKNLRYNSLCAIEVENPKEYGCLQIKNGFLLKIDEKSENPKSNLVNAGIYFFKNKKIFKFLEKVPLSPRNEYELTDGINMLAKVEKIKIIKIEKNKWLDVGTKERLEKAKELVKRWNMK